MALGGGKWCDDGNFQCMDALKENGNLVNCRLLASSEMQFSFLFIFTSINRLSISNVFKWFSLSGPRASKHHRNRHSVAASLIVDEYLYLASFRWKRRIVMAQIHMHACTNCTSFHCLPVCETRDYCASMCAFIENWNVELNWREQNEKQIRLEQCADSVDASSASLFTLHVATAFCL